ncbi:MAG TPA: VOC family protein [Longimicrobiaceae bacterium]|nr:VOC family protein [Longimicrobiaceae bacterium]
MPRNAVGWFEIYVQDMERAKAFYEAVFLQRLDCLESGGVEMWAFRTEQGEPGSAGALVRVNGMPSGGNSTLVYFMCDDCAVAAARVEENGGKLFREKFSIGEFGFVALAYDTEGNLIGLHSMK